MQTASQTPRETAHDPRQVRVHIDRHPYESPTPTTGAALYVLGKVPPGHQLYREVQGNEEDEPVYDDGEKEHLKEDEHFYSEQVCHKGFEIIVNAQPEHLDTKKVSYEQVVKFAFPTPPPGENIEFLVTYYNGPKQDPKGTLTAGHSVKVKNEMVFNVQATNRS